MSNSTLSITTTVGIVFIVLKLCGLINWSWWWVLCPFWLGLAVFVGAVCIVFGFVALVGILEVLAPNIKLKITSKSSTKTTKK